MKVGILAGGLGSRLSEETEVKPKPMVEIGSRPILWHIMMHYSHYGFKEFVLALGYKGETIKHWMKEYCALNSNMTVKTATGQVILKDSNVPDWTVDLVDTGLQTMTGGRLKRMASILGGSTFMLTYGDGVADVNLNELISFHKSHGRLATLTAVRPMARFGHLKIEEGRVAEFSEKPQTAEGWINGAFFVLEPGVIDYIEGDSIQFEKEPLEALARNGELMAFPHTSFWQCMDTLRDKRYLERLWESGSAPWKTW